MDVNFNLKRTHVETAARRERTKLRITRVTANEPSQVRALTGPFLEAVGQIKLDKPLAAVLRMQSSSKMKISDFNCLPASHVCRQQPSHRTLSGHN